MGIHHGSLFLHDSRTIRSAQGTVDTGSDYHMRTAGLVHVLCKHTQQSSGRWTSLHTCQSDKLVRVTYQLLICFPCCFFYCDQTYHPSNEEGRAILAYQRGYIAGLSCIYGGEFMDCRENAYICVEENIQTIVKIG